MPRTTFTHPGESRATETDDLVALLRERGQRVTSQRLVILRELRRHGGHATAEEIHRVVHRDLPGTSTPTVYATLDLLVDLGLARKLDLGTGSARYESADAEAHQHAVCRHCGRIEDLDLELDAHALLRAAGAESFQARNATLVISGLCAECAAATE